MSEKSIIPSFNNSDNKESNFFENIKDNLGNTFNNVTNSLTNSDSSNSSIFPTILNDDTSSSSGSFFQNSTNSLNNFMTSNSLVTKFCFLLFVLIGFLILLTMSMNVILYIFSPSSNQKLINGMINASTEMIVIPQDPNDNSSKTIYRSINETQGIEFTWSIWTYINEIDTSASTPYKHIFSKGNYGLGQNNLTNFNNAPGLYLSNNINSMYVVMDTYTLPSGFSRGTTTNNLEIPDIPLNKWVNIIIICKNNTINVYVNGIITKSEDLEGIPKQNYGDVYIAANKGFNGYISNLWYYNYALGTLDIQNLVKKGPNTTMKDNMILKDPDYLSLRWYFDGTGDMYNP
jgi:hypothetical protein